MKQVQSFPSWREIVEYDGSGPKRKELTSTPAFKTVLVGFEAGQKIDPHPAPEASYHVLEGSGWIITDGERFSVNTGATVIVPDGISRGIEAGSRLAVLASHPVPGKKHLNPMPFKKMGIIGLISMVVMAGLMIGFGRMIGGLNPMISMMASNSNNLGLGLWGMLILPTAVMLLMMGIMFFSFRKMSGMVKHKHNHRTARNDEARDENSITIS